MKRTGFARSLLFGAAMLFGGACSSDNNNGGGTGGTGGSSATGGTSGRGGSGGSGTGGNTAAGGASGTGGTSATGGSGGAGGATGGSGGSGGSTGGSGATGGSGGTGGGMDASAETKPGDGAAAETGGNNSMMSFFITSRKGGGNLGGLEGADKICKDLATAVGAGNKNWKAYLSTGNPVVNAKDRIGAGPWFNQKGVMVAMNLMDLHDGAMAKNNLNGMTALDERGNAIPGRMNRPAGTSNEHDILTGTQMDGTVAMGFTCGDWRMETAMARIGHFDRGGGGGQVPMSDATSWNSSHNNQGCSPTTIMPGGGAGRFYCFAAD